MAAAESRPDVAVVVVAYQAMPWIERCIASVRAGSVNPAIVIVDNGSDDGTAERVAEVDPASRVLRLPENVGFGRGNNAGIAEALRLGASKVLLLNQDALVLPDTIERLAGFLDRHPTYGVVSPLQCSPDAEHIDRKTYRGYLQCHAEAYLTDACLGRTRDFYEVHGMNAAIWMVRAEVWRLAGGFDPLFFMYGEDDDLLARWKHHGVRFALLPGCRAIHLRESVKSPQPTLRQWLWRRSERRRSELLNEIKRPRFSLAHSLSVLLGTGFLSPLAEFPVRRDWRELLGQWLGAVRIARELPRIRQHQSLTERTGSHFL